jgi:hypothetical protein
MLAPNAEGDEPPEAEACTTLGNSKSVDAGMYEADAEPGEALESDDEGGADLLLIPTKLYVLHFRVPMLLVAGAQDGMPLWHGSVQARVVPAAAAG